MHLHGKFFLRKKKLDQQGKARILVRATLFCAALVCVPYKLCAKLAGQFGKCPSSKRAVGYRALVTGKPGFANRVTSNFTRIKRRKVARAPDALMELRLQK